jgi:hypothetical protein
MAVRRNFMIWTNLIEPTTSCLCERDQCRRHRSGVYQHKSEPCSRCLGALTYNHCAGNICIWCWVIATDPSQEAGPAVGPPYCFPSFTPMMRKAETRYLLVKMLWRITAHSRVMSITIHKASMQTNQQSLSLIYMATRRRGLHEVFERKTLQHVQENKGWHICMVLVRR